jgi:hypothetical protein
MATVTLTTSASDDTEMAQVIGYDLALGRNATAGEIKTELIRVWTAHCTNIRKQMNIAALAAPTPIAPT